MALFNKKKKNEPEFAQSDVVVASDNKKRGRPPKEPNKEESVKDEEQAVVEEKVDEKGGVELSDQQKLVVDLLRDIEQTMVVVAKYFPDASSVQIMQISINLEVFRILREAAQE